MPSQIECPLWVKSGHVQTQRHVRYVPKADVSQLLSDLQMQYRSRSNKIVRNGAWIMRSMGAEPAFGVTLRQNGGRTIVSSLPPPTGKR